MLPQLKKGNLENLSKPRPAASASKTLFLVLFFLLREVGKNSNQTWISFASDMSRTNIETKYDFYAFGAKFINGNTITFPLDV